MKKVKDYPPSSVPWFLKSPSWKSNPSSLQNILSKNVSLSAHSEAETWTWTNGSVA